MKVALVPSLIINTDGSSVPYIPLGLLSIKGCLKGSKLCDVELVDLNCKLQQKKIRFARESYKEAAEYLIKSGYNLIGFSSISSSFHHVVSLARRIKELDSKVLTVVGGPGPHASSLAAPILERFPCIDYIVQVEGELVFPRLISSIQRGKRPLGLPGVLFRNNHKVVINKRSSLIADLDDLPVPDFANLEVEKYLYTHEYNEPILRIEEGRGCPFKCSFCSTSVFWCHKTRRKSFKRVLEEMDLLNRLYSIDHFSLINDCFNANRTQVLKFCQGIENINRSYAWGCSVRLDLMTDTLLDRLWNAGCRGFFTGIESGAEKIQRLIGKNLNLPQIMKRLEYAVQKGFHIITSFIIGFPEETKEDLRRTMELHKRCLDMGVAESQVNLLTPLHGSRLLESGSCSLEFDGYRTTISDNLILREHLPLILKYPGIFATYYYYKPKYVDRREFIEMEMFGRLLAKAYRQR